MRGSDFVASVPFETLARERAGGSDSFRAELSRQRRRLVEATTAPRDRVAVPAHASRDLVDTVKACDRTVVFAPVDPTGATDACQIADLAAVWHQTVAGNQVRTPAVGRRCPVDLFDAHDTVVLDATPDVAGVVLRAAGGDDASVPAGELVASQYDRVAAITAGLGHAAGLPTLPVPGGVARAGPVPTGVVVRLPAPADPLTFAAYAQAELTGIEWFALRRPLHPQARHHLTSDQLAASLDHLARLMIVPVGPFATDEEVGHAVLGIVKTAEYTGWRWCDDPEHAALYARWITDRYGSDHEAYRPAFEV